MHSERHPLHDEFDAATSVRWHRPRSADGSEGSTEIGFASNGLVAWRKADEPNAYVFIFFEREWKAFIGGVQDGEFELAVLDADAAEIEVSSPPRT